MRSNYGKALRNFLQREIRLEEIIDFGELPVFQDAATFPAILITRKAKADKQKFLYAPIKRLDFTSLAEEAQEVGSMLNESALQGENWTLTDEREQSILNKMRVKAMPLAEYINDAIFRGVVTGFNEAFVISRDVCERLITADPRSAEIIKPYVVGDDVRKYQLNFQDTYIIFTRRGIDISQYPQIEKHLFRYKDRLIPRSSDWKGEWTGRKVGPYQWYEIQDTVVYHEEFTKSKIIYPVIAKEPRFAFDTKGYFSNDKTFIIPCNDLYLLGLLNSKLSWLYLKRICSVLGDPDKGGRLELRDIHVRTVPIHRIDFANLAEKDAHDGIVALIEQILALHKERAALDPSQHFDEIRSLERRISQVDAEIDRRVYGLYGLTEEEIKIVEGL